MEFKNFLLNENRAYLGEKCGDILNALQDLVDNAKGIGTRQLVGNAEGIVNQIRRILHTHWSSKEEKNLKQLQKAGVAIMRAIEEKDDLVGILPNVIQELQNLLADLEQPVNKMANQEEKAD
jgi:hypothetical protein